MLKTSLFYFFLTLGMITHAYSIEHMDEKYCIPYGNPEAKVKITGYFSFSCPRCIEFFTEDFPKIKEKYIDTGKVFWVFHPNPTDVSTIDAMICFSQLEEKQKKVFLGSVLPHSMGEATSTISTFMKIAMKRFDHPLEQLGQREFVENTQAFQEAFTFLVQKEKVYGVPTIEVNGVVLDEYPTFLFVSKKIEKIL